MNSLELILSFVVGLIASVAATFLFPALQNAVAAGIVRVLGWLPFRQRASFAGNWKATWYVESNRYPPQVIDDSVLIRQFGKRIYAKFKAGKLDCYLVGTIDDGRYITGTWYDETQGGYHGAFQFVIDPSTKDFSGRWIGFSTTGVVKGGSWEWERNS